MMKREDAQQAESDERDGAIDREGLPSALPAGFFFVGTESYEIGQIASRWWGFACGWLAMTAVGKSSSSLKIPLCR